MSDGPRLVSDFALAGPTDHYKLRVQVKDAQEAKLLQSRYGGWCVETGDHRVFWYRGYTQTQIIKDMPGDIEIY